jgi:hypothetical protein
LAACAAVSAADWYDKALSAYIWALLAAVAALVAWLLDVVACSPAALAKLSAWLEKFLDSVAAA